MHHNNKEALVLLAVGALLVYVLSRSRSGVLSFNQFGRNALVNTTPTGYYGTPAHGGRGPYVHLGSGVQNAAFTGAGSPAFSPGGGTVAQPIA